MSFADHSKAVLHVSMIGLALTLALAGCATKSSRIAGQEFKSAVERSGEFQAAVRQPQQLVPVVVRESTPRFVKHSIPLQRAAKLPVHIGNVTLRYPGRHSLAAIAELISRLIDIPVIMTPDALAGAMAYAPTGGTNATASPGATLGVGGAGTGGANPGATPGVGGAGVGASGTGLGVGSAGMGTGGGAMASMIPQTMLEASSLRSAALAGAKVAFISQDELQNSMELN